MEFLEFFSQMLSKASHDTPVKIRTSDDIHKIITEMEMHARVGSRNYEPQDLQVEAVKRFWFSGQTEKLRDDRLVAFGLSVKPWGDQRCVMEDKKLFDSALAGFDKWKPVLRQYRKCYQGLVHSYFEYDEVSRNKSNAGMGNWRNLRKYLTNNAAQIRDVADNPDWVTCVVSNTGLFSEHPCEAYGQDLLISNVERVNEIRRLLNISDASWFTHELVFAQFCQAIQYDDKKFQQLVNHLLDLLRDNFVLRDRCLQILLNRYVQIEQPPKHPRLEEYCVHCWGNPWLPSNQDRWGGVKSAARLMIENWLKLKYIELFFTKLTDDGIGDPRRMTFWAKYVPSIEGIHFALGNGVRKSIDPDFIALMKELKGLTVDLIDINPNNNAFIMRMGDLIAVEFSGSSNAFYGYSVKNAMPFDLSNPVTTPVDARNSLKQTVRKLRLNHNNRNANYSCWEDRFRDELENKFSILQGVPSQNRIIELPQWNDEPVDFAPEPLCDSHVIADSITVFSSPTTTGPQHRRNIQRVSPYSEVTALNSPRVAPASVSNQPLKLSFLVSYLELPFNMKNLYEFARQTESTVQDRSNKGGVLWVITRERNKLIEKILAKWLFTYKPDKGWWRKII